MKIWKYEIKPIVIFSSLSGVLSLFKIIEDFDLIELYGTLKNWVDSYVSLINFLFGWIDFNLFSLHIHVSEKESHYLVLIIMIGTSTFKGFAKRHKPDRSSIIVVCITYTLYIATILFSNIYDELSYQYFIYFGFCSFGMAIYMEYRLESQGEKKRNTRIISKIYCLKEIRNIFIIFGVLIALNFTIFRHIF